MQLLREVIGEVLRRHRTRQGRTLRDVSAAAAVSLGYLSEVERGKKEPSSELLAAICEALRVPITLLLREVSEELARSEQVALFPVPAAVDLAVGFSGSASARHAAGGVSVMAAA